MERLGSMFRKRLCHLRAARGWVLLRPCSPQTALNVVSFPRPISCGTCRQCVDIVLCIFINLEFQNADIAGIHGWNWEVACTFVELLADITLHGSTSAVQKRALVGNNKDITDLHRKNTYKIPMKSAGLLDLVYFKAENESKDWGKI